MAKKYKWEIPPKSGHMDTADGIYFQSMTMKGGKHIYTIAYPP